MRRINGFRFEGKKGPNFGQPMTPDQFKAKQNEIRKQFEMLNKKGFEGKGQSKSAAASKSMKLTEIVVQNAEYSKLKPLLDLLATKGKVAGKEINDGVATIKFEHAPGVDLADLIDSKLGTKFSIKDLSGDKITLVAK